MRMQTKRSVRLVLAMLAASLVALWPPVAEAGRGAHRSRHVGNPALRPANAGGPHRTPPPKPARPKNPGGRS